MVALFWSVLIGQMLTQKNEVLTEDIIKNNSKYKKYKILNRENVNSDIQCEYKLTIRAEMGY